MTHIANGNELHFKVVVNAMARAFSAKPTLLNTTKGYVLSSKYSNIYTHHAVFKGLADPKDTANITGIEITGKPVDRVVGKRHRLLLGFELENGCERAKGFFGGANHIGSCISKHRWLKETT